MGTASYEISINDKSSHLTSLSNPNVEASIVPTDASTVRSGRLSTAQRDRLLVDGFTEVVASIDVEDIAVPATHQNLPKNIGRFSVAPLVGRADWRSSESAGWVKELPTGFKRPKNMVISGFKDELCYLDANLAIGMAFDQVLFGVAAAGLMRGNLLRIVQIQGIGKIPEKSERKRAKAKRRRVYQHSGLNGGLRWDQTLVMAWAEVAKKNGFDQIWIQSWLNNPWHNTQDEERRKRLKKRYDGLAREMGFTQGRNRNWVLSIS